MAEGGNQAATATSPNGERPKAASSLAPSPEVAEKLLDAVNDASGKAQGYWVSLLGIAGYLAVTVGGTTHRQLLLIEPVKLPLFDIRLSLVTFFALAPAALVIMHLFVLVQLALLARSWRDLDARLSPSLTPPEQRDYFLDRLDTFAVTQWLAGRRHSLVLRTLILLMVWITLLIGPVVLLLTFQIRFLPYHDEAITTWQRLVLLADLAVLWVLWPMIRNRRSPRRYAVAKRVSGAISFTLAGLATVAVLGFATLVATIPGGHSAPEAPLGQWWVPRWLPTQTIYQSRLAHVRSPDCSGNASNRGPLWNSAFCLLIPKTWITKLVVDGNRIIWVPTLILFEGPIDRVSGQVTSLFSRNLVLPDADLSTDKTDQQTPVGSRQEEQTTGSSVAGTTLSLRRRDLRYATLSRADMRAVDLIGAKLEGSDLTRADLRTAKFSCAFKGFLEGQPDEGSCTNLQGALLTGANLESADLSHAQLKWAELSLAELQNARLNSADLERASLSGANLRRAQLNNAIMRGADIRGARLEGADLTRAELGGAKLNGAALTGARLSEARAEGADLESAKLEGADLASARLQTSNLAGADLRGADLSGADLRGANLDLTSMGDADAALLELRFANVWRTVLVQPKNDTANFDINILHGANRTPLSETGYKGLTDYLRAVAPDIRSPEWKSVLARLLKLDPSRDESSAEKAARLDASQLQIPPSEQTSSRPTLMRSVLNS